MSRVVVNTAVPGVNREEAASMAYLSGRIEEHSVELTSKATGPSHDWDVAKGYDGKWWGARQALNPYIAQSMLQSGYMLGTESWFAAFDEMTLTLLQHNLPVAPVDASFDAFLEAAGLQKVIPPGGYGG